MNMMDKAPKKKSNLGHAMSMHPQWQQHENENKMKIKKDFKNVNNNENMKTFFFSQKCKTNRYLE